jgi:hypothetical protein
MIGGVSSDKRYTGQEIEAALIDGHWCYGGLIHQKTADVLLRALKTEASDTATGHALAARVFGEYAAALETHGAWAWALRNRFERGSFLDAYLDYTNKDVADFYKLVRSHEGDLSDLLRLPSPSRVQEVAVVQFPEWTEEEFAAGWAARYDRLEVAADLFFGYDGILIQTYNKTKHGAPMVRIVDPENPRRFEFVVTARGKTGGDRYDLVTFTLGPKLIGTLANNVKSMTTSITELASLTRMLVMLGLLYEREG